MPVPDRPVTLTTIDSEWGQAVHDYTFAPKGCEVHSSAAVSVGTSGVKQNIDVADDDPGGFLDAANDQVVVPTDGGGLYVIFMQGRTVNGSIGTGFKTRFALNINGTSVALGNEDNEGGTNLQVPITWFGVLSAGDIVTVFAQRRGAGTNPSTSVDSLILIRLGAEFGA